MDEAALYSQYSERKPVKPLWPLLIPLFWFCQANAQVVEDLKEKDTKTNTQTTVTVPTQRITTLSAPSAVFSGVSTGERVVDYTEGTLASLNETANLTGDGRIKRFALIASNRAEDATVSCWRR